MHVTLCIGLQKAQGTMSAEGRGGEGRGEEFLQETDRPAAVLQAAKSAG